MYDILINGNGFKAIYLALFLRKDLKINLLRSNFQAHLAAYLIL